jgi:AcrR family transcriptional regulator
MGRKDLTNERQDAILDAAENCIAKYGFLGATLKKIASEAGINRGLIHHYIGNRDEVVQLMVERLLERYQSSCEAYIASQPKEDRAEVVVRYYFDAWFELAPEDDALSMELLAESERDSHIRKLLHKIYDGFETMIERS